MGIGKYRVSALDVLQLQRAVLARFESEGFDWRSQFDDE